MLNLYKCAPSVQKRDTMYVSSYVQVQTIMVLIEEARGKKYRAKQ